MNRIAIMGCSGSGKSTLARALGEALDLPVHHIDAYHWQPGWKEPDDSVFIPQIQTILNHDRWIIDGGYSKTDPAEIRFREVDALILFDRPIWLCLWRVFKRVLIYRNTTRPDRRPGCPEKLDWEFLSFIWNYRKDSWPKLLERAERNNTPTIFLNRDPDIRTLVERIRVLSSKRTPSSNP